MFNDELIKQRKKNRLICEIRHKPFLKLLDEKGMIIEKFSSLFSDKIGEWKLSELNCNFLNHLDKPTKSFNVGFKRSSITYEDPQNLNEFFSDCYQLVKALYEVSPSTYSSIVRLGVRITSVFEIKDLNNFELVNNKIISSYLSNDLPFKEEVADNRIILVFQNSKIQFGPVDKDDKFIKETFKQPNNNIPEYGIAFDIDAHSNFLEITDEADITKEIKRLADNNFDMEHQFISKMLQ